MAYLSSIFVTLSNFKHNFTNRINNFSNWLIEGNNVELCSAGDETGKIYKYYQEGVLLLGDINFDGEIDILDVVLVVNFALNITEPTSDQSYAADVNGDGVIDVLDIVNIVNLILS